MSVLFILVKWPNVHCTNRIAGLDLSPPTFSHPYILITRYCIGNLKRQKFQFSSCDSNGTIFITIYLWEQTRVYPLYSNRVYPLFPRKSGAKETESSRLPRRLQLGCPLASPSIKYYIKFQLILITDKLQHLLLYTAHPPHSHP